MNWRKHVINIYAIPFFLSVELDLQKAKMFEENIYKETKHFLLQ